MLKRILTSAIGLIFFFAALLSGTVVFNIAMCFMIAAGLYEIHKSTNAHKVLWAASGISALFLVFTLSMPKMGMNICLAEIIIMYMAAVVLLHGKVNYTQVLSSMALTLYIVIAFSSLAAIRGSFGTARVLLVFLIAWITDTSAYFGGNLFGKHKLAPNLSPKKTVEGSACGVLGTVICGAAYWLLYKAFTGNEIGFSLMQCVIICLIGSVLSQVGDLAASAIKRDSGIKDFGWILPGHGGLIDRFDSVIYIAPVIYYFFVITL